MPGVKNKLTHERHTIVPIGLLNEQNIPKKLAVAMIGKIVSRPSHSLKRSCGIKPKPCLPNQVERSVGDGDIFFYDRSVPTPPAELLPKDKSRIPETQKIFKLIRIHYIFPISSGMLKKEGCR